MFLATFLRLRGFSYVIYVWNIAAIANPHLPPSESSIIIALIARLSEVNEVTFWTKKGP